MIDGGLADNEIGDDGAMELAQSLQHNTTPAALNLNGMPRKSDADEMKTSFLFWHLFISFSFSCLKFVVVE